MGKSCLFNVTAGIGSYGNRIVEPVELEWLDRCEASKSYGNVKFNIYVALYSPLGVSCCLEHFLIQPIKVVAVLQFFVNFTFLTCLGQVNVGWAGSFFNYVIDVRIHII